MSTAMNFGTKSFQPRPPDKGSFPLDHLGECKRFQEKFMRCLRDSHFESARCRSESKDYLECRMERCSEGGRCSKDEQHARGVCPSGPTAESHLHVGPWSGLSIRPSIRGGWAGYDAGWVSSEPPDLTGTLVTIV
ncbi:cytochrome c oxidase assembly protein COX19 isoform X1 [Echinops telfairi]|uniref:Cytochrome c oxidase assembly protein COX19 isoform X1 n=1 Tax=Echinops telfairi TaxID=9371 RepID=A0AC55CHW2_ECHTE|nr:cytochrome c oxidase assembly protein COX19 isoform X1 [Echinops telfairi]